MEVEDLEANMAALMPAVIGIVMMQVHYIYFFFIL